MIKQGDGSTIIGRGAKLRGDLTCSEDLLIDGQMEGTLRLTGGRLTIGPEAQVRASIGARDVVVFGRLDGDVRVTGRLELRAGSVVVGDIFAARLSIEDNATLRGQVDPTRAGEPVPAVAPGAGYTRPAAATPKSTADGQAKPAPVPPKS